MDSQFAVGLAGVAIAALCCVGSAIAVIWQGGKFVGRVEKSSEDLKEAVALVFDTAKKVAVVDTRIATLESVVVQARSDHRELARTVGTTRDIAIRAASQHDLSEAGE